MAASPQKAGLRQKFRTFFSFLRLSFFCHSQFPMSDKAGKTGSFAEKNSAGTDSNNIIP
jgi:hypothetical protein